MPDALTIPLPSLPEGFPFAGPLCLSAEDRSRLAAYVSQATAEAVSDWLTEAAVERAYDEVQERTGWGRDRVLPEVQRQTGVSAATARRIMERKWARQPENRAA